VLILVSLILGALILDSIISVEIANSLFSVGGVLGIIFGISFINWAFPVSVILVIMRVELTD
jgi:hypothetical protein